MFVLAVLISAFIAFGGAAVDVGTLTGAAVMAVLLPVRAFVLPGFGHSVANMYFFVHGWLAGSDETAGLAVTNVVWVTWETRRAALVALLWHIVTLARVLLRRLALRLQIIAGNIRGLVNAKNRRDHCQDLTISVQQVNE